MNKRFGIRFRLTTLICFVTFLSVLLGYIGWRRQSVLREVEFLESQGYRVSLNEGAFNWLWPKAAKVVVMNYEQRPDGRIATAKRVFTADEWTAEFESTCDRLRGIGVEDIKFIKRSDEQNWYYVSTSHGN